MSFYGAQLRPSYTRGGHNLAYLDALVVTRTPALSWTNRVRPGCLHSTRPGCQGIACAHHCSPGSRTQVTGGKRPRSQVRVQALRCPAISGPEPSWAPCYPGSELCSHHSIVPTPPQPWSLQGGLFRSLICRTEEFPSTVFSLVPLATQGPARLLAQPSRDPALHAGRRALPEPRGFQSPLADTCLPALAWAVPPAGTLPTPFPSHLGPLR